MKLSIVGTPIGNLEDITLRALRTLRECDVLVCEDTRVTKGLLFHYEITEKPLWAYDENSHARVFPKIIEALESGQHLALVSDAGMPAISDPGSYLISEVRRSNPNVVIEVIPGPTALTSAVAWSGVDTTNGFDFYGFVPHKKGRETLFKAIVESISHAPAAAYESSHRISKTVEWFIENSVECTITVCREITKLHEECISGTPAEIALYLQQPNKDRGEFVIIWSK